jgi:DNA-binding GntR family transcriptional regulator
LEGFIARLVASRIRPEDLAHLQSLVAQMYEAARNTESGRLVELDAEFHRYLGSRSGSRLAYRFLLDLQARTKMFIAISKSHYPVFSNQEVAASHEPILEALRTGDPNFVELRVVEHIKEAGERLVRLMEQESEPVRASSEAGRRG